MGLRNTLLLGSPRNAGFACWGPEWKDIPAIKASYPGCIVIFLKLDFAPSQGHLIARDCPYMGF